MTFQMTLSAADLDLLIAALDAYEYWELGRDLPRSDGLVYIPGDAIGTTDRYWPVLPSPTDVEAIVSVRRCRALVERLTVANGH